jgi:hypothetical protein
MGKSQPNHRFVKIHRSHRVGEVADLLGHHKNTVRAWIKDGLSTIDGKRPRLILGRALIAFLQARRAGKKQPCGPGRLYCVRCHAPKFPAGDMVECRPITEKIGNLTAICPDCNSMINRRVSMAKSEFQGPSDVG